MNVRAVKVVGEVSVGDVVLTGSVFYRVTDVGFLGKFRGRVWGEAAQAWGGVRDVPLPSPTCAAHVVEDADRYFPPLDGAGDAVVHEVIGCTRDGMVTAQVADDMIRSFEDNACDRNRYEVRRSWDGVSYTVAVAVRGRMLPFLSYMVPLV